MQYTDAIPELQLLMRLHDATIWEQDPVGYLIGVPTKGRGNPYELRRITAHMLDAARRQIKTGVPALRGQLDFPRPEHHRRSTGKRRD